MTLVPDKFNGRASFILLDNDGKPIPPFTYFIEHLVKKCSDNTVTSYAHHLAKFFDYLAESTLISHDAIGRTYIRVYVYKVMDLMLNHLYLKLDDHKNHNERVSDSK